ncbi:thiol-disulfide oxidoreductase DCC family protein [Geothrix sp. PMB-07]|uniref:thiol-disulfide oxidoreductase DCC family protein n=1 Tax=Geothrix sp. PMB-07 TaxID=3068640 RepID=UPI0027410D58|nr:DUF393 domain-containing protein [Geothrix sp. PMB-07]WLT31569.1 DUF393 domain-containing protein [Geothrix sp. PMB-07]
MGADQGLTRLFFDGECGLCDRTVRLVARHDRSRDIRFAPLGGGTFQRCVAESERANLPDSLVVQRPEGELLLRSEAVIHLLSRMGPGWRTLGWVMGWIPRFLRDGLYGLVAWLRPARRVCARNGSGPDDRFEP